MIVQNIAGRKLSTGYSNQTNLNGKLRKKLWGQSRNLGGPWPTQAPPLNRHCRLWRRFRNYTTIFKLYPD